MPAGPTGGDYFFSSELPATALTPEAATSTVVSTTVAVTFRGLTAGDEIRMISDAGVIATTSPDSATVTLEPRLNGRFLRFEVWQGSEPRLFTNPVYAD